MPPDPLQVPTKERENLRNHSTGLSPNRPPERPQASTQHLRNGHTPTFEATRAEGPGSEDSAWCMREVVGPLRGGAQREEVRSLEAWPRKRVVETASFLSPSLLLPGPQTSSTPWCRHMHCVTTAPKATGPSEHAQKNPTPKQTFLILGVDGLGCSVTVAES